MNIAKDLFEIGAEMAKDFASHSVHFQPKLNVEAMPSILEKDLTKEEDGYNLAHFYNREDW